MQTLGIDPIHRLVVPRVYAFALVSIGLFGIVTSVGIAGTYAYSCLVQGASPGLFIANLTLLTGLPEFLVSVIKSMVFGIGAALVSCFLGLNAKGAPKHVLEEVTHTGDLTLVDLVVSHYLH